MKKTTIRTYWIIKRFIEYYGEKYGVKVNKSDKGTEIQLLLGIENLEEENKDKWKKY